MDEYQGVARRTWRRTAVIVAVGLIVGGVFGWLVSHGESLVTTVFTTTGFAFSLGGIAGAFSVMATSFRIAMKMQAPMQGLPRPERQMIGRAIKTGVPVEPAGSELGWRAFDQARLMAVYQPLALGQFLLLYLGILGPQLPQLMGDEMFSVWLSRVLCSLLVVAAVVVTPMLVRSSRRARRYVEVASASS
ncbi:hypothetical protein [Curtobacterium sp. MCPF17_046]|uniref:hypothetical protein n=1 Tax=Curtobacterium sp. MCPF17_046 TaxID=2175663 RepID=UPI000D85DE3F|nr:hypothetical protein [Curtobacterium sp. MCPF17_046]PYY34998.1 hypothetical protein DEJ32_14310 [Curtobacterium sp. MCPF17_046]